MPPLPTPLSDATNFSLNSAGVAGFFGGKEAISAMATVHMYKGRRWFGWFNSPGSYVIARRFGRMANSRFWDGLFPGPNDSPAVMFGLDGKRGPKYIAALSGTEMKTGHLAYLTIEHSKNVKEDVIGGRETKPIGITYLAMEPVNYDTPVEREPIGDALLGLIPISVSAMTCIMCAVYHDWYSFSMILLGMISSGLASIAIGKGSLIIKSVDKPASGAPPGHGILMGDGEVVVIKGNEQDVNAITKGRFELETDPKKHDKMEVADPKQGVKEKPRCNGGCNCPKEDDEEDIIKPEPCGDGGCSGPKPDNEENEREVDPITEGSPDLAAAPEQSDGISEIDPKQAGEETFVEEKTSIKSKQREGESITHGRSVLETSLERSDKGTDSKRGDEKKKGDNCPEQGYQKSTVLPYHSIGFSSLLLILQFLLQLLLIPQGSLFGQIMFLISLGVSWGYNSYLSSLEKEKIQTELLFQTLGNPKMRRFRAGTRTAMAVFVCLLLFHDVKCNPLEEKDLRMRAIRSCVSNDTPVWRLWLEKVVEQTLNLDDSDSLPYLQMDKKDLQLSAKDRKLLRNLLKDAAAAIRKYLCIRKGLPVGLSTSVEEEETENCICSNGRCCDCNTI